jgi:hypothetical protein
MLFMKTLISISRASLGGALLVIVTGCEVKEPVAPQVVLQQTAVARSESPPSVSASATSPSEILVTWQDNATKESGWELYRSTTGSAGAFSLRVSYGPDATTSVDRGLSAEAEYCYQVRWFKVTGRRTSYSAFSNTACATTPAPPPPPPPAAPTSLDARPANSNSVLVQWSHNSTDESGFRVERSTDQGMSWVIAGSLPSNGAELTDQGLASEAEVCYRVIAFNATGDSPPSNTDCTTPPAAPTDVTESCDGCAEIELTWVDNSAVEDGYGVYALVCWGEGPPSTAFCPEWPLRIVSLGSVPSNSTQFTTSYVGAVFCYQEGGCDYVIEYFVAAGNDGGSSNWSGSRGTRW